MTVTHEVEIQSIAAGGDGVARADGLVIFVPRTAPGDVARIRATAVPGGHFARGVLEELLVPSPDRIEPSCIHYTRDRCGGCQLQHLRYDAQLAAKGAIVRDALVHIAHRSVGSVPVIASERQWRYRQKLTLALRKDAQGRWIAGLHRLHSPGEIFPMEDCSITDQRVVDIWRQVVRAADLLPDATAFRVAVRVTDPQRQTGGLVPPADAPDTADCDTASAVAARHGRNGTGGRIALIVAGGRRWPRRAAFEAAVNGVAEVWWTPDGADRPSSSVSPRNPGMGVWAGETGTEIDRGAEPRTGASFAQVNPDVARRLHAAVVERVLAYSPDSVVDAYAGTGTTALELAAHGVRVTAIEADPEAGAACARSLPSGSRALIARVEDVIGRALPTDVVLVNPPRVGLAAPVTATLEQSVARPRAIIYVSCDPATLARDVSRLSSWRIASIHAFDMFPQTAHVETLCELVPQAAVQS